MDTTKKQSNTTRPARSYGDKKNEGSRKSSFFEKPKPEFDQKMVSIRRVTRVTSGGRRMTFAVAIAIGDKKGSIGLGTGKGTDTAIAITKALRGAKKSMFKIKLTKENSIPHPVNAKFSSSKLMMMPNRGKGIVAGSTVRDMLILAGLKNVTAKIHSGSKNKLNNARCAYAAFYQLRAVSSLPVVESFIAEQIEEAKTENKE